MTDEIKIWAVDGSAKNVQSIPPTNWKETEGSLEDVLVKNPNMLLPGVRLVGRQTPTENGYLDLLGVDDDGSLIVFELKRREPTRDAVAQAIDYCSYLESLPANELASYIEDNSGKKGIDKIDDFIDWYYEHHENKELNSLKPVRIALVGLGFDAVAQRMVTYLASSGIDISLLTFQAYECGERTLLARQVDGGEAGEVGSGRGQSRTELRRSHDESANELGIGGLWKDSVSALSIASDGSATKSGITFYMGKISLDGANPGGAFSVVIDRPSRKIRITFYPASVHLCWNEFQDNKTTIPFDFRRPPNAPTTNKVQEEWYCMLDAKTWASHKESLIALANNVHSAWRQMRRNSAT